MTPTCIARAKGTDQLCGRRAVGFLARREPRCGFHYTERERLRVRAARLGPEERKDEDQPRRDEEPDASTDFDPERFAGPELDD